MFDNLSVMTKTKRFLYLVMGTGPKTSIGTNSSVPTGGKVSFFWCIRVVARFSHIFAFVEDLLYGFRGFSSSLIFSMR